MRNIKKCIFGVVVIFILFLVMGCSISVTRNYYSSPKQKDESESPESSFKIDQLNTVQNGKN
jgi:hypothetical protein